MKTKFWNKILLEVLGKKKSSQCLLSKYHSRFNCKISPSITLLYMPGFKDHLKSVISISYATSLSPLCIFSFLVRPIFSMDSLEWRLISALCLSLPSYFVWVVFIPFHLPTLMHFRQFRSCILHKLSPTQPAYSYLSSTDFTQHHMLMMISLY